MASDKRSPPGTGRRKPPTIELKATEIASEPVKPAEPIDPPKETPRAEPPEAAAGPQAASPDPRPEAQRPKWQPEWLDVAALQARAAELRAHLTEHTNWRLVGAGAVGAAVMLALLALFAAGAFSPRDDASAALATRLSGLESQLRDLAGRPQPTGLDQRALADLAARVGAAEQAMGRLADFETRLGRAEQSAVRLGDLDTRIAKAEQSVTLGTGRMAELDTRLARTESAAAAPRAAQPDAALNDRIAALEGTLRSLGEVAARIDAAGAAAREANTRADAAFEAAQKTPPAAAADHQAIEALAARVAALEQAAKSAQERIASTAGADKAGRLAFVAVALRATVERGDPFAQELAAVKPLVSDAKTLAALEPFAAGGVPRVATLAREFSQLNAAMLAAAGAPPRDGGIMDRLQANAERLVRIRPISEAPGDDPTAIIARADVKAAHGDLAGAVAEVSSLPPAVRAPAQAWIARVEARNAALAAARNLADAAVGALARN